jgi:hypothetical protein
VHQPNVGESDIKKSALKASHIEAKGYEMLTSKESSFYNDQVQQQTRVEKTRQKPVTPKHCVNRMAVTKSRNLMTTRSDGM